jgi:ubiquinone/menaquinone biosynthesis C-methylase UbiE
MMSGEKEFTPALGYKPLTPLYDLAVAVLTRENRWRRQLVDQIAPAPGDRILDVGCGTGSLATLLKKRAPDAEVIGLDPDAIVLSRAKLKSDKQRLDVIWRNGFLTDELVEELRPVYKVVSSLVLHQTPLEEKQRILNRALRLLSPGGELHIADYGQQQSKLMRGLFRLTVQTIDGVADTQPNADGVLPELIRKAGFSDISVEDVIPTFTGSISLYCARC